MNFGITKLITRQIRCDKMGVMRERQTPYKTMNALNKHEDTHIDLIPA